MFWIGFGLFNLAETLRADGLDKLAAVAMNVAPAKSGKPPALPTHWRAAHNAKWHWYERETFVDGRWVLSGISTPINKKTGEPFTGKKGYLDQRLVPADERVWDDETGETAMAAATAAAGDHKPDPARRRLVYGNHRRASGCTGASRRTSCGFGSRRSTCPRRASKA